MGSSSTVWRWDGGKFRGLTTESTPIQESEGGFTISTYSPQASIQFESPRIDSEGSKQHFILVGSSSETNDTLLYRARSDSVTCKYHFSFPISSFVACIYDMAVHTDLSQPKSIVFSPDGGRVYIGQYGSSSVLAFEIPLLSVIGKFSTPIVYYMFWLSGYFLRFCKSPLY
jgi:hypothetical protein